MATVVSTKSVRVFIDPSAALAPVRYGFPPHEIELRQLENSISKIASELLDVDVVIVTHYHYDHHDPGYRIPTDRYSSKFLLIKNPVENINISQKIRASKFLKIVKNAGARVQIADGKAFEFGSTKIVFSNPVPHGNTVKLGYVVMVRIEDSGDVFSFSSDVEGPLEDYVVRFACGSTVSIVDGPPTYLVGRAYTQREVQIARENLVKLSDCVETLVVDHHLMRDLNYVELFKEVSRSSTRKPISAAELLGVELNLLEARRSELYGISREE